MPEDHPTAESPQSQPVPSLPSRKITTCGYCGALMEQRKAGRRLFCSRTCSIRSRHGKPKPEPKQFAALRAVILDRALPKTGTTVGKCDWCGEEFRFPARLNRLFCSHSCSSKHQARTRQELGIVRARPKPKGITRPCEICGTPIYVRPWQQEKGQGRFCGRTCKDQWCARNARMVPCKWCGKEMKLSPSSTRLYCSNACWAEGSRTAAIDREHNGRRIRCDPDGYLYVWEPEHPKSGIYNGWYAEHRLVMERELGRILERDEQVHHLNNNPSDNRPENLAVVSASEHQGITVAESKERRRAERAELAEYRRRFGSLG